MANIDLSDLFNDFDLTDPIPLIRRKSFVDDNGLNQLIEYPPVQIFGSVQPPSGRTLKLMPDLLQADGAIEIWTSSALQSASKNLYGDIIIWQNSRYEVLGPVDDWQNFGGGFTHVVATLKQQAGELAP
jgi:hypothetical protein